MADAAATADNAARALSVRLFLGALSTQETLAAYLGVKLGIYQALSSAGAATVDELAERTALAPRYLREWLEQQAVSGVLAVEEPTAGPRQRRYLLPAGHERVLTASGDPLSLVAAALLPAGGVAAALPALIDAFRTGAGVPDDVFGDDWRQGHGGANRAIFTHQLAGWLRRHAPAAHARLSTGERRIVDLGCGAGWASLALARAYPAAEVLGVDRDAEAVEEATERARMAGIADRVRFRAADLHTLASEQSGQFDLVCLFDTLHEAARPVETLAACRRLRADGGHVVVMDARVADQFTAPGDEIERFQYATSVLHCLPAGLAEPDSAAPGTVLRASQVVALATQAGFTEVNHVALDDRFHRLYQLGG